MGEIEISTETDTLKFLKEEVARQRKDIMELRHLIHEINFDLGKAENT